MFLRTRFALARQRLTTCNYFALGLALAIAGGWDEIKPLLVDVLSAVLPGDRVAPVMGVLGILVILVRTGWALRPPPAPPAPPPVEDPAAVQEPR